jgi:porphyrinogen peroxidase
LTNMFIGNPPGNTDRILDFSTALTGTLFFVPTASFLDDPPARLTGTEDGDASQPAASAAQTSQEDGSLGIGSLKGATK